MAKITKQKYVARKDQEVVAKLRYHLIKEIDSRRMVILRIEPELNSEESDMAMIKAVN